MLRLVVKSRSAVICQLPLSPGQSLSLGRSGDNDVVLPFPEVSQQHASLQVDDGSVWLEDLGSRNGLAVDDRLYDRLRLRPGRTVRVGPLRLFVEEIDSADAVVALDVSREATPATLSGASETTSGTG